VHAHRMLHMHMGMDVFRCGVSRLYAKCEDIIDACVQHIRRHVKHEVSIQALCKADRPGGGPAQCAQGAS